MAASGLIGHFLYSVSPAAVSKGTEVAESVWLGGKKVSLGAPIVEEDSDS